MSTAGQALQERPEESVETSAAPMRSGAPSLRKWLAIGTGVGIEICRGDLNIAVARVRPTGVRVIGFLTIHKFRDQPAAEWGGVYASFLKKLGAGHLTATVLLPREDVIVRHIPLPGVADRDVPAALKFQIDSLHPYAEEEAVYDWSRIGKTSSILVGITRRAVIGKYAALFAEAGVKISSFTVSAAVMYSAVRLYEPPRDGGFVAIARDGEAAGAALEVYGESEAHPVFSARLDMPEQRALALALAQLRLSSDREPAAFESILPTPAAAPAGEDLSRMALPYATALAGACPWLGLSLNLLPPQQRSTRSRWMYAPTIALACVLLIAIMLLAAHGGYENRRYAAALEKQIQKIDAQARRAAALDRDIAIIRNRAQTLDNFRVRSREDMDALNDLTRILAPPTWLSSLQLTRTSVTITGETDQSAPLLKALDGTKQFKRSEFTLPMSRTQTGESFTIRAAREGITP